MRPDDLIFLVINPALSLINMSSVNSIALLAGTCSQETNLGQYLIQTTFDYSKSPNSFAGGLGIFQMQKETHDDIVKGYLPPHTEIFNTIKNNFGEFSAAKLIYNLQYAAVFARLFYARIAEPIPNYLDVAGLAAYYKKYYNTFLGKATPEQFILNYNVVKPAVLRFANG